MSNNAPCVAKNLNHVCIAVKNIEKSLQFYESVFGVKQGKVVTLNQWGIKATMIKIGNSQIEFIEPITPDGSIARFIERKGESMHHICLEVENIDNALHNFTDRKIRLIDKKPHQGLFGKVAFIHPSETQGILIELVEVAKT